MRACSILLVLAVAGASRGYGQACILVTRSDGHSTTGLVVRAPDGHTLGLVDALGRFCPGTPCDTLVFTGNDIQPVRFACNEARLAGSVRLEVRSARELDPVPITPWPSPRDRQALAAVSTPDSALLAGFERSSLRSTLLWVPGVQVNERGHGGSQRLSIRGSLLRASYGVRGVKVYWGPFALTLADGSTPLELLDPELVGSLDVVRSVGGPVYGSAPSGLLLADAPWAARGSPVFTARCSGGSDGFFKVAGSVGLRQADGSGLTAGVLRMGTDGYRRQEWARRDQAFLATRWRKDRTLTRAYLTFQRSAWALPGSIDKGTAIRDPRSARPYSQAIDAHIEKDELFAGLGHELSLGRSLRVRCMMQMQAIDKKNPYGTTPALSGNKDEHIRAAGARASLGGTTPSGAIMIAWEAGIEALFDRDDLNERTYANAVPGDLRTDALAQVGNLNTFASTRTRIGDRTTLFADLGVERTVFRLEDRLRQSAVSSDRPGLAYPLVGVERTWGRDWSTHVRYAESTSRPTVWELLGSTGVVNPDLRPEDVREWEAGVDRTRGRSAVSITGYVRRTRKLILSHITADGSSEEFRNSGDAEQNGVEASGRTELDLPGRHRLVCLINGAWQHHRLSTAERPGAIDVPGVPRWSGGILARGLLRWRTTVEAGVQYGSSVRASTVRDDRVEGFTVVHLRVDQGFRTACGAWNVFVHVENLLDEHYTTFVQLNDPGLRYFNPAPARSVYLGVVWTLQQHPAAPERGTAPRD